MASIPNEQMVLSGAWGTESLPGWLWPAGPRAAVLFPDLGFQAGWLRQAGWAGAGQLTELGGQLQPWSGAESQTVP